MPPSAADLLLRQFLAWIAETPRSYADVMEAWKSSCPRLTVWEDASLGGLVQLDRGPEDRTLVVLTARGRRVLAGSEELQSA